MLHDIFKRYIILPLKFSLDGFKAATHDRSFRLELILGIIFYPWIFIYFKGLLCLLLTLGYSGILLTESFNCAIEKIVNLVSPNFHPLAKEAKDIASFSVFISFINFLLLLCYAFYVK